ncbi:MAG: exopolysaccharide biosynthesis protein [Rhodobiaceae bacterium]|nr:exopolysaccharide biosynthesis protein [Rhodobiaceae bacterium]
MQDPLVPTRRSMSLWLLQAANRDRRAQTIEIETLLRELGERSFGWSLLLFALVNLLPLPLGSTLLTGIPLLIVSVQMVLQFDHVRLPGFITRRQLSRTALRQGIIRLQPLMRRIERIIHPRQDWVFAYERLLGVALFLIAFALFLPLPLSGWLPALSMLIVSFGIVERDGTVTLIGLGLGLVSILVTVAVLVSLLLGIETLL